MKFSQDARVPLDYPTVRRIPLTGQDGLELLPIGIRSGKTSGYQAVNLAILMGARRVVLLGYDMRLGPDGRRHWFGDHPAALNVDTNYESFALAFETMVAPLREIGATVVNATPGSAITAFPRADLEDLFP